MTHHETAGPPASGQPPETRGRTIRYWTRFYDLGSWLLSLGQAPAIRKTTLERAEVAPGEKVLDVGCGTGSLAIAAKGKAGADGEVHGIDASPEMIEVAQRKAARKRADVRFKVGLIEDMPFPDGEFDLVLNSFMLHHLPEDLKRKGFAEIRRVLKPGGRFLAVDLGPRSGSVIGHLMTAIIGHHMVHGGADALASMMRDAGLADVEEVKTKHKQVVFLRAKAGKTPEVPS